MTMGLGELELKRESGSGQIQTIRFVIADDAFAAPVGGDRCLQQFCKRG